MFGFDSGAMPLAQWHYPFENKQVVDGKHDVVDTVKSWFGTEHKHTQFPADYISEAIDQTRGWFYTMLAISTLLDRGAPYKNVINLGHLLDEKGQKMSKSKGNVINPWKVIDQQGVDGLRWYMYSVNQPGDSKLFSVRDVELIVRKHFLTLWNVLSFLTTYANNDNWQPSLDEQRLQGTVLDSWMYAKTKALVLDVTKNLDNFDVSHAARAIEEFINELSTWYVRRSRDNKSSAMYQTLYDTVKTLSIVMAPFVPFFAENVYQALKQENDPESVHLADWPKVSELSAEDKSLLESMDQVRKLVEQGHSLRKAANIKLRQPLSVFYYNSKSALYDELEKILSDELNVKKVEHGNRMEFDVNMTAELRKEGLAAELTRTVQDMRKKQGLKVGEVVNLLYDLEDQELIAALQILDKKKTYINEILAEKGELEEIEIEGKKARLGFRRD
jgi:isoleucyl-tRNA synthetase